jgi:hypothetical protein
MHALAIQRYYNVNCLLAGASPSVLDILPDSGRRPTVGSTAGGFQQPSGLRSG